MLTTEQIKRLAFKERNEMFISDELKSAMVMIRHKLQKKYNLAYGEYSSATFKRKGDGNEYLIVLSGEPSENCWTIYEGCELIYGDCSLQMVARILLNECHRGATTDRV